MVRPVSSICLPHHLYLFQFHIARNRHIVGALLKHEPEWEYVHGTDFNLKKLANDGRHQRSRNAESHCRSRKKRCQPVDASAPAIGMSAKERAAVLVMCECWMWFYGHHSKDISVVNCNIFVKECQIENLCFLGDWHFLRIFLALMRKFFHIFLSIFHKTENNHHNDRTNGECRHDAH